MTHNSTDYLTLFGKKFRKLRNRRGVSQDFMADIMGYGDRSMISHIENGRKLPSVDKIQKAAAFFGVHPAILMSPTIPSDDQLDMAINLVKLFDNREGNPHFESIKSHLELAANWSKNE